MSDVTLNKYLAQGDDAAEAAFTPDPVTGTTPEQAVLFVNSETPATPVLKWWDGANFIDVSGGGGGGGNVNAGGTLTSNAIVIGQGSTDVAVTTTAAGILTFLGTPSSANLAAALTDETGTGAAVFANTPTLVSPVLGTPTSGALTNCTSIPVNQATGDLPFANLTQIAGLSVLGVTGSATADVAAITAGTDGQVLTRVSSSSLAFASPAMVKIEEQSPTGTAVTFSSLGSFNSLRIVYSGRGDAVAVNIAINMTFNADTGGNYDTERLSANATTVAGAELIASTSIQAGTLAADSASTGNIGAGEILIPNYALTTFHKAGTCINTFKQGDATTNTFARTFGWAWRSTSAITSITLTASSGNYKSGTKFTLYGMS